MKKSQLAKLCLELLDLKDELKEKRKEVRALVKLKDEKEEQIEREVFWIALSSKENK